MTHAAWFPSPLYTQLVQAALHTDDTAALKAWREWSSVVDLPHSDVDRDIIAVLPLLAHRLARIAPDEPLIPRLRGFVRYSWTKNQLTIRATSGAIAALHDAGIETLLFKGAALSQIAYDSVGFRPMDDIDVLIPLQQRAAAIKALDDAGWTPVWMPRPGQIEFVHGVNFRNTAGQDIDLHWYALLDGTVPKIDDDIWKHSRETVFNEIPTRSASPTDLLLLTFGNAARADGVSARWIVDAALLIQRTEIDWDRLVSAVIARRLMLYVAPMLWWLQDHLAVSVPPSALQHLELASVALWEYIERRFRASGNRRRGMVYDIIRYMRLHGLKHPDADTPLHYGKRFHDLHGRRYVPMHIFRVVMWRMRYAKKYAQLESAKE